MPQDYAEKVILAMQSHPTGRDSCIIGHVTTSHPGMVLLKTIFGSERIVDMLVGSQLPRIC